MAILNITHNWKLLTNYFSFPLSILGLTGWRISLGFWCRITHEAVLHPSKIQGGTPYKYRPLDLRKPIIRLLTLEPGGLDDPLIGRLEEVDLDQAGNAYVGLSYVWGSHDKARELFIEGTCVPITLNLDKALRQLRSAKGPTTLWADAVCINQYSTEEKGHQVPLMTRIYAEAEAVFAWLGDATANSQVGVEILNYLVSDQPFNDNAPWNRLPAAAVVGGLDDILRRTYFQRVWIVQEAAVSRQIKMQVGRLSMHWHGGETTRRFLMRIKLLEISPAWQTEALGAIDLRPIRELLEQSVAIKERDARLDRPATLLELVHAMRHMQSTDPRDKIYGLMGLASPADVAGFKLDYMDTWENTYRRFYDHVYQTALEDPNEVWRAEKAPIMSPST